VNAPPVDDAARDGGVTWVDFDNDGDLDLSVANGGLWRNDGDFHFTRVSREVFDEAPPLLRGAVGGTWADFDNDGDMDLFVPYQFGESARYYVNEGGRLRQDVDAAIVHDGLYGVHGVAADFDNNGWLDLFVAAWGSPSILYLNTAGTFTRASLDGVRSTPTFASSAAAADYDGDGDLDLVVGNWPNHRGDGEANHLWRNDGPAGRWLQLDLTGTRSNRSAIGARISALVALDGRVVTLSREVRSQAGWRSQSPFTVHLGVGPADSIMRLTVRWPSGHTDTFTHVRVNRRLALTEGGSLR
jgi:hypothetical protein